jgi:hypothetical protein
VLAGQVASLAAKEAALEAKQGPTSLSPNGPAGGDLTGSYPKPQIAPNAVGAPEIAPGSVGSSAIADRSIQAADFAEGSVGSTAIGDGSILFADLAGGSVGSSAIVNGSVGSFDLGPESVGAPVLGDVRVVHSEFGTAIKPGDTGGALATCPPGTRLLSGGFEWAEFEREPEIISSRPSVIGNEATTWEATGAVRSGTRLGSDLLAYALCLNG